MENTKQRLFEMMSKINPEFDGDIYYHGSNSRFNEFDLYNNKTYREFDLPVWFFTKDLNYAKTYGKFIYEVKLSIKNTFDTTNNKHFQLFINYLKENNMNNKQINDVLDEKFYRDLPYWTCEDAYYAAISNNFDSILIQEELSNEVISTGVFHKNLIKIINIREKKY